MGQSGIEIGQEVLSALGTANPVKRPAEAVVPITVGVVREVRGDDISLVGFGEPTNTRSLVLGLTVSAPEDITYASTTRYTDGEIDEMGGLRQSFMDESPEDAILGVDHSSLEADIERTRLRIRSLTRSRTLDVLFHGSLCSASAVGGGTGLAWSIVENSNGGKVVSGIFTGLGLIGLALIGRDASKNESTYLGEAVADHADAVFEKRLLTVLQRALGGGPEEPETSDDAGVYDAESEGDRQVVSEQSATPGMHRFSFDGPMGGGGGGQG